MNTTKLLEALKTDIERLPASGNEGDPFVYIKLVDVFEVLTRYQQKEGEECNQ